jgi:hypothetical protein
MVDGIVLANCFYSGLNTRAEHQVKTGFITFYGSEAEGSLRAARIDLDNCVLPRHYTATLFGLPIPCRGVQGPNESS